MSIISELRRFHEALLRHTDGTDAIKSAQKSRSEQFISQIKKVQHDAEVMNLNYEESIRACADMRRRLKGVTVACEQKTEYAKKMKEQRKVESAFAAEALHHLREALSLISSDWVDTGVFHINKAVHLLEKLAPPPKNDDEDSEEDNEENQD